MLEKFGAAEDDEDELNAIYYRDYLKTFEKAKKSKSKNVIKVISIVILVVEKIKKMLNVQL